METQVVQKMKHSIRSLPFSELWRHCLPAFNLVLLASLFFISGIANADVNSVSVTPSSANLNFKSAGTISATWQVNRTEASTAPGPHIRTVSSSSALLQINGATVATLAGTISTTSSLGPSATGNAVLNETLSLSPALMRQIARSSAGSARIVRSFSDTQAGVVSTSISLFGTSGANGPLTVRRINLAFENSARTDVVYSGDTVHAIADIAFRSSGILKGEWRIVDPSASLGSSGGRVLRVIRQNLVSAGDGRTRIVSPALPTSDKGLYLVSFVVEDANTSFDMPVLRYFVLDKQGSEMSTQPSGMTILAPANGVHLNSDTVFHWQSVNGAKAYQLEIYNPGQDEPLTGKLVPASEHKLSLSEFSFDWLQQGQYYDWRLRAFGPGGKLIAQSDLQLIYLPEM